MDGFAYVLIVSAVLLFGISLFSVYKLTTIHRDIIVRHSLYILIPVVISFYLLQEIVQMFVFNALPFLQILFALYLLILVVAFIMEKKRTHGVIRGMEKMIRTLEEQLSSASENGPIPGIHSRAEFDSKLAEMTEIVTRYGQQRDTSYSVILLGLDNLDFYNEEFGYAGGDKAVKMFGAIVRNSIRSVDFAARYGADEFALILPEIDPDLAYVAASRILIQLESENGFESDMTALTGRSVKIPEDKRLMLSAGIAGYRYNTEADPLDSARHALRHAKAGGKRQIVVD